MILSQSDRWLGPGGGTGGGSREANENECGILYGLLARAHEMGLMSADQTGQAADACQAVGALTRAGTERAVRPVLDGLAG